MPIYIDTETTGLDPQTDDVIEIAIIGDAGNVLLDTLCRPLKNNTWDDAQRIHGITPAMCAGRPSLPDLIPQIQQIISQHDEVVIYNANFDASFLQEAGLQMDNMVVCCAMQSYSEHIGEWSNYHNNYRWHKLTAAAAYVGHEWLGEAHRALADAQAARSVWQWLQGQKNPQEVTTCQHHTGCGGYCETEQEVSFNLCEDCLDAYFEEEEDRNKQRWIPTDQRLPSPQQDVIFIVSADAILDGRKLGGRYLGDGTFSVPGQSFKASHWMPMPSGPEIK